VKRLFVWIVLPLALTGCNGCPGGQWQGQDGNGNKVTLTFREIDKYFEEKTDNGYGDEPVLTGTGTYATRPAFFGLGLNEMDIAINGGETRLCIYKVENDILTVATGNPRPSDFSGGQTYTRIAYKEETAEAPDGAPR
jgi:hypothetical protein